MSNGRTAASKRKVRLLSYVSAGVLASMILVAANAATVANPNPVNPQCAANTAQFAPANGQGINVPAGFNVRVFAPGLNMPTGIAFRSAGAGFEVFVPESGHGLPSACNDNRQCRRTLRHEQSLHTRHPRIRSEWEPQTEDCQANSSGGRLAAGGPAIDIAFERGLQGGRLFATDSNQATHAGEQKQQFTYRDRGSNDRDGYAIHYGSAHGRSPDGAVGVQG